MSKKDQQIALNPLVNAVLLISPGPIYPGPMSNEKISVQANILQAGLNNLPKDFFDHPWVKKVRAVCKKLQEGNSQKSGLEQLFEEGKSKDVLPYGYSV